MRWGLSKSVRVQLVSIPAMGVAIAALFGGFRSDDWDYNVALFLANALFTAFLWNGNGWIVDRLRARFPDLRRTPQRMLWQVVGCVAYTVGIFTLLYPLAVVLFFRADPVLPSWGGISVAVMITTAVTAIFEAVYFFEQWRKTYVESERLKRQTVQSQLDTLRAQVSPHFLFNNLNTLATLIPEDSALAVRFVEQLSGVYRYLLQTHAREVVPLREELDFLAAYVFLLDTRFGAALRVEVDVPEAVRDEVQVPPVALQILLENAVKHNVAARAQPLRVSVRHEADTLVVRNNRNPRAVRPQDSTRLGLRNIRERYGYLSNRAVEVAETDDDFTVRLPLLRVEAPVPA
ncbi:MAG: histidine kinase [Catalinimonas sp.]